MDNLTKWIIFGIIFMIALLIIHPVDKSHTFQWYRGEIIESYNKGCVFMYRGRFEKAKKEFYKTIALYEKDERHSEYIKEYFFFSGDGMVEIAYLAAQVNLKSILYHQKNLLEFIKIAGETSKFKRAPTWLMDGVINVDSRVHRKQEYKDVDINKLNNQVILSFSI